MFWLFLKFVHLSGLRDYFATLEDIILFFLLRNALKRNNLFDLLLSILVVFITINRIIVFFNFISLNKIIFLAFLCLVLL